MKYAITRVRRKPHLSKRRQMRKTAPRVRRDDNGVYVVEEYWENYGWTTVNAFHTEYEAQARRRDLLRGQGELG